MPEEHEEIAASLTAIELEVVCDALWFAEQRVGLDPQERALWERLKPLRTHSD